MPMRAEEIEELTAKAKILSMGPSASRAIKAAGMTVSYQADEHTITGIIDCLKLHFAAASKEGKSEFPEGKISGQ